ncbi:hypothetical protein NQ315_009917 [Exocentrus adspersus]|uniref:Lipoyl-binding domain-containing protein n=1 Tax=Exocentrus adspersus TaxID=1586481 RepID=A0AAV8WII6_9CUCU|nr:hypothetical protein NQ315_009917 [Exocentrus adspersus]
MSKMLAMAARTVPRSLLRTLNNYLERGVLEAPFKHRTTCQGAVVVCKYSIRINNGALSRVPKTATSQSGRYFRTSVVLLDSQVVKCPPFPESVTEGDVRLEKKVGDHVAMDETVMEIETDKTAMPVHSPGAGIIEEILVKDGDTVKAGQPLFKLNITGEAPPPKAAEPAKEAPAPPPAAPKEAPPPSPKPQPAAAPPPSAPPSPKPSAPPSGAPPPPKPPLSSIPVAAIRHAQSLEAATVKIPPAGSH